MGKAGVRPGKAFHRQGEKFSSKAEKKKGSSSDERVLIQTTPLGQKERLVNGIHRPKCVKPSRTGRNNSV